MSKISLKSSSSGTATFTIESPATNTDRTLVLPDVAGTVVAKTGSFIAPAELGSGTADSTTFLRGDSTFTTLPSSAPTTTQVLDAYAGASVGAVGTYAFLATNNSALALNPGDTIAGSSLRFIGLLFSPAGTVFTAVSVAVSISGTWRAMGFKPARAINNASNQEMTVFLRIS